MKNIVFFIFIFFTAFHLSAQESNKVIPVSVGAFGSYVIQPGAKIGTSFTIKERETKKERNNKTVTRIKSIFAAPQVGFFIRPKNSTNFLLNVDLGYKTLKKGRNFYSAFSIGFGYLTTSQILSNTIDLSSGKITDKDRERRNYFLPVLNYEFGQDVKKKIGWYLKLSYGRKISGKIENAGFFAIEPGIRFNIKTNRPKS